LRFHRFTILASKVAPHKGALSGNRRPTLAFVTTPAAFQRQT